MIRKLNRTFIFVLISFLVFDTAIAQSVPPMAIIGDAGLIGLEINRLRDSIQRENVASLILPGDNLYMGSYKYVWGPWKRDKMTFDVVAIGNHNGGYAKEISYFKMPGEYYSVVKSGARFLVLNSDNENNVAEQFAWLENEIGRVTENLIFLVFHHPPFSLGHNWRNKESFHRHVRMFLQAHRSRVTALLLGHDHISSFLDFDGTPAVIAGSGREANFSRPISNVDEGIMVQTKYLAPATPHWAELKISDDAKNAAITFVRVSDQARVCTAHFRPAMAVDCP